MLPKLNLLSWLNEDAELAEVVENTVTYQNFLDGNVSLIAYLIAGVLFILSLGGLSKHESARRGNWYGIVGILIAMGTVLLFGGQIRGGYTGIIIALAIGSAIGITIASRVEMTSMPQLVAILHSFVGLAAVLVGLSSQLAPIHDLSHVSSNEQMIHKVEIFLGVFIGALTFTGSVIAFGKLDGKISSKPLMLPHRHLLNLGMIVLCLLLGVWYMSASSMVLSLIHI